MDTNGDGVVAAPPHKRDALRIVGVLGGTMLLILGGSVGLWVHAGSAADDSYGQISLLGLAGACAAFVIASMSTWYHRRVAPLDDDVLEFARVAAEDAFAQAMRNREMRDHLEQQVAQAVDKEFRRHERTAQ